MVPSACFCVHSTNINAVSRLIFLENLDLAKPVPSVLVSVNFFKFSTCNLYVSFRALKPQPKIVVQRRTLLLGLHSESELSTLIRPQDGSHAT